MLNKVIIMGRLTREPELKQTANGQSVLRFTVAVDRYSRTEEKAADFLSCVAWGQRAEFISNYFGKGRMIALEGSLRSGAYDDKNGVRHYTTDIWVDNVSFTGEPRQQGGNYQNTAPQNGGSGGMGAMYYPGTEQPPESANAQQAAAAELGDLSDFEEVLSDGTVPF